MRTLILSIFAVSLSATAVTAADDPVAARKMLMQSAAAAAGISGGMMKGDIDYNPAIAKSAIATLNAVSHTYGDYFPEGSSEGETTASPKIWEDGEGWQAALEKFQADTSAAAEASGKDGPADLAAFQQAVGPVLGNCKSCHENFRVQKN
ncbi:c-type cytochrome [Nitratireductor sp. CH_MIT9313-5]|uniref:c-type cytochrome n=1 Tax=Nitratireductor sp. CH_MIT9313-5 TaxID=3107764 RepID=UPI00300B8372